MPSVVAPHVLFRSLLVLPRPTLPIPYRIRGAEGIALSVQAINSGEVFAAEGDPVRVAAAALLANGRLAFAGADELAAVLARGEIEALATATLGALAVISPTFAASQVAAWRLVLTEGCHHRSNWLTAYTLGRCFDAGSDLGGTGSVDRPDRFFGVPQRELVDAHWIAFSAAKEFAST